MSEEECIKEIKFLLQCKSMADINFYCSFEDIQVPLKTILDLYNNQKQRIETLQVMGKLLNDRCDDLKAINDEHKKENGELRATIKDYEEKQNKLAFKTNQYMNDVLQNKIVSKSKVEKEFEKFISHNNCFNLGDMQMLLDNIIEED